MASRSAAKDAEDDDADSELLESMVSGGKEDPPKVDGSCARSENFDSGLGTHPSDSASIHDSGGTGKPLEVDGNGVQDENHDARFLMELPSYDSDYDSAQTETTNRADPKAARKATLSTATSTAKRTAPTHKVAPLLPLTQPQKSCQRNTRRKSSTRNQPPCRDSREFARRFKIDGATLNLNEYMAQMLRRAIGKKKLQEQYILNRKPKKWFKVNPKQDRSVVKHEFTVLWHLKAVCTSDGPSGAKLCDADKKRLLELAEGLQSPEVYEKVKAAAETGKSIVSVLESGIWDFLVENNYITPVQNTDLWVSVRSKEMSAQQAAVLKAFNKAEIAHFAPEHGHSASTNVTKALVDVGDIREFTRFCRDRIERWRNYEQQQYKDSDRRSETLSLMEGLFDQLVKRDSSINVEKLLSEAKRMELLETSVNLPVDFRNFIGHTPATDRDLSLEQQKRKNFVSECEKASKPLEEACKKQDIDCEEIWDIYVPTCLEIIKSEPNPDSDFSSGQSKGKLLKIISDGTEADKAQSEANKAQSRANAKSKPSKLQQKANASQSEANLLQSQANDKRNQTVQQLLQQTFGLSSSEEEDESTSEDSVDDNSDSSSEEDDDDHQGRPNGAAPGGGRGSNNQRNNGEGRNPGSTGNDAGSTNAPGDEQNRQVAADRNNSQTPVAGAATNTEHAEVIRRLERLERLTEGVIGNSGRLELEHDQTQMDIQDLHQQVQVIQELLKNSNFNLQGAATDTELAEVDIRHSGRQELDQARVELQTLHQKVRTLEQQLEDLRVDLSAMKSENRPSFAEKNHKATDIAKTQVLETLKNITVDFLSLMRSSKPTVLNILYYFTKRHIDEKLSSRNYSDQLVLLEVIRRMVESDGAKRVNPPIGQSPTTRNNVANKNKGDFYEGDVMP